MRTKYELSKTISFSEDNLTNELLLDIRQLLAIIVTQSQFNTDKYIKDDELIKIAKGVE